MTQARPDPALIAEAVAKVEAAVSASAACRRRWKRRQAPARAEALTTARKRCADSVPPLRSWLGMTAFGGIDLPDELAMKRAVQAARYERRQLDKMLLEKSKP